MLLEKRGGAEGTGLEGTPQVTRSSNPLSTRLPSRAWDLDRSCNLSPLPGPQKLRGH